MQSKKVGRPGERIATTDRKTNKQTKKIKAKQTDKERKSKQNKETNKQHQSKTKTNKQCK